MAGGTKPGGAVGKHQEVFERIIALLEARLRSRDSLKAERMQRFLPLARSLSEESEETALLAMLLDDFYQETFHAPLVPPDSEETPPAPREGSQRHGPPRRAAAEAFPVFSGFPSFPFSWSGGNAG